MRSEAPLPTSTTGSDVEAIEVVISRIEVVGVRWYQLTSDDDLVEYTSSQWSPSVDTYTECPPQRHTSRLPPATRAEDDLALLTLSAGHSDRIGRLARRRGHVTPERA